MTPGLQKMIIYLTSGTAVGIVAYAVIHSYLKIVLGLRESSANIPKGSLKEFLSPLGEFFRSNAHRSDFIKNNVKEYDMLIVQAGGFWGGVNGFEVLAAKFILPALLFCIIMFLGLLTGIGADLVFLAAFFFSIFSYMYPDSVLKAQSQKRRELFMRQLPGGLDILKVAAEAGLDFHSSVNYLVGIYIPGPLKEEMQTFQRELKLGIPTVEALGNIAHRINVPEASTVLVSLAQSIEMGTSIVDMLESTTTEIRKKRLLSAETEAQKAVVKITFPLLLLILPGIFIVLLAPILKPLMQAFAGIQ